MNNCPSLAPTRYLEAIKDKPELESEQQHILCEQDGIDIIPVSEKNIETEINKSEQYINDCSGVEISECDDTSMSPENDMGHKLILKPFSNPQTNNYSNNKQAEEEAMKMTPSDSVVHSSQEVSLLPIDDGQQ